MEKNASTIKEVIEYLESLKNSDSISAGGINNLIAAPRIVYSAVYGNEWGETLIRNIDLENDITRFIMLSDREYPDTTIKQYKARIRRGIAWFSRHIEDPNWQPVMKTHKHRYEYHSRDAAQQTTKEGGIYNFLVPLRDGEVIASLRLPPALDKKEAKRVIDFINCLVTEE